MKSCFILPAALIIMMTVACSHADHKEEVPVARVYKHYLYLSDFEDIFPEGVTPQDSAQLAKSYIASWVRNQVTLHTAEKNLNADDMKQVDELIDNYRQSLILYHYNNHVIDSKGKITVSNAEIESYYDHYPNNFTLSECIIKTKYLIIPASNNTKSNFFKKYLTSKDSLDIDELVKFSNDFAINSSFDENWHTLDYVNDILPGNQQITENQIANGKTFFDINNDINRYIVYIADYIPSGNISPLDYVKDNIHNIIINKKKKQIVEDNDAMLYKDALDNNNIEIY